MEYIDELNNEIIGEMNDIKESLNMIFEYKDSNEDEKNENEKMDIDSYLEYLERYWNLDNDTTTYYNLLSFSKKYILKDYSNDDDESTFFLLDKECYENEIEKLYTFLDDNIELKKDLIERGFFHNGLLLFDIIYLGKEVVRINNDSPKEDYNILSVEYEDKKNIGIINNYVNLDKLVIDDLSENNNNLEDFDLNYNSFKKNIKFKSFIDFLKKEEYFFMTIAFFGKLNKVEEKNEIEEYIFNYFSENILLTELADNEILDDKNFLEKFNDYGEYDFSSNLGIRYLGGKYYLKSSNNIYPEDIDFINFLLDRKDNEEKTNFEIKENKIIFLKNFIKFQDRIDNLYKKDFIKTLPIKNQNQLFKYLNELLEPGNFNEAIFEGEYKNIYSRNKPDLSGYIDFDDVIKETKIEHNIYDFDDISDDDKINIFESLIELYNKNYNNKNFIEDIKNDLANGFDSISKVHLFSLYEDILSLYEKKVDDDTIYMGGLNSNKNINFGFKFF
ncbi:MAG: hypothetical protein Q9M94_06615 [Candidatus Gracilibacteria bacterium]|nr:hypothetical protein [Candidatus Gracilibacteria bacterium]MDQ7023608.1 hypothetical protein [Candidatus Gracilibacteria bacterium]